jgi:hypothetical protein
MGAGGEPNAPGLSRGLDFVRIPCGVSLPQTFSSDGRRQMGQEHESAAAEVERLTRLRDEAEKGNPEHRELITSS